MIIPVILCGGSGTRLWPLSRELYPKQLIPITGGELSLLQETVKRLANLPEVADPIIICNEHHRFMVAAQMQALGIQPGAIILEPVGRSTAPAAAIAGFEAVRDGTDPLLLVLPADHLVEDTTPFVQAILCGCELARSGAMVTFGIEPTKPETGYGYIGMGTPVKAHTSQGPDGMRAFQVGRFVEKPDYETACTYLAGKEHLWNSGMFLFSPSTYFGELNRFAPKIFEQCQEAFEKASRDLDFLRLHAAAFEACPSDSIDYAVMERTERAVVIPLSAGWSDVGSWSALHEVRQKDETGNVLLGDVIIEDVHDCYLHSSSRMIAAIGLRDHVLVETKDAVLVAPMARVQDVKSLVDRLRKAKREEAKVHARVYRPWGCYECVDTGDRFQVKRITVNPGAVLSLQKHHHRAEHWIVVKGTARIVKGDAEILITEDQSTYVPLGTVHRLENPGRIPLELIEVQTGSYLGEDDIVRLEDVYGR